MCDLLFKEITSHPCQGDRINRKITRCLTRKKYLGNVRWCSKIFYYFRSLFISIYINGKMISFCCKYWHFHPWLLQYARQECFYCVNVFYVYRGGTSIEPVIRQLNYIFSIKEYFNFLHWCLGQSFEPNFWANFVERSEEKTMFAGR